MQKKNDKENLLKKLLPVILFVILAFFVVTVYSKNQGNNSQNSNESTNNLTKTEIDLPAPEINLERASESCLIGNPNELPQNWPSDLPIIENIISIESKCFDDNPSSFQARITVQEAYSYLAFALVQDIKLYGWNFTTETPGVNPESDSISMEAEKEDRILTLQMTKLDGVDDKPATLLIFTEKY